MKKLALAAIGCGHRTRTYLKLAAQQPDRYEIVAAAEPNTTRLDVIRSLSGNPGFQSFPDDHAFFAQPRMADVVIIGTQDAYHEEPCIRALEKGYDVLLEKPIASRLPAVLRLEQLATRLNRRVMICHVLRYTPLYQKVKEVVVSGMLGDVLSLRASEGVEAFHQAHSFVRGHWGVTEKSSPMIIAKCCHDLDIIAWLMDRSCLSVASYGDRSHFRAESAPPGVPAYCVEGCPVAETCPYHARRYLGDRRGWLKNVFDGAESATDEDILQWLGSSPWGRCVYRCDNTAVDHQVVAMEFAGGATATLTMTAFDHGRNLEIYGTKGVLRAGHRTLMDSGQDIIVELHGQKDSASWRVHPPEGGDAGHGGGDPGLINALYGLMTGEGSAPAGSSIQNSVSSHVIGFAAEEARLTRQVVDIPKFLESIQ